MPKKKARKPVGTSGVTKITVDGGVHQADFQKIEFSAEKEAIEAAVVIGFVASARESLPALADPPFRQNAQDDFDFDLLLADRGLKHLELKEIAPLQKGPYETARPSYNVYDFAQAIRSTILKQSERYKGSTGPGLYLLLYVTDWRFLLSPNVVMLLRYWAIRDPHCFQRIYVYQVRELHEGFAEVIYPERTPPGFNPELLRVDRVQNGDPTKMISTPNGVAIDFGPFE